MIKLIPGLDSAAKARLANSVLFLKERPVKESGEEVWLSRMFWCPYIRWFPSLCKPPKQVSLHNFLVHTESHEIFYLITFFPLHLAICFCLLLPWFFEKRAKMALQTETIVQPSAPNPGVIDIDTDFADTDGDSVNSIGGGSSFGTSLSSSILEYRYGGRPSQKTSSSCAYCRIDCPC
ncbi:methyltransferase [Histoplasma capsulatum G186AR]|uniref:Methyltransferase n=1 Tax=Ajellomyces capsulatus TaxID=5037 RepID=A0A8H8CWR8_AJECA|nr:methyltransferase [Histoplasma capsulatum]QSS74881.1 methyltransferase [Histoplasma capsulatum G186AR]